MGAGYPGNASGSALTCSISFRTVSRGATSSRLLQVADTLIPHATLMDHIRCITFFTFITYPNYVYQFTRPGNPVAIIATYLEMPPRWEKPRRPRTDGADRAYRTARLADHCR